MMAILQAKKMADACNLLYELASNQPRMMQAFHGVEVDMSCDRPRITFWASRWRYEPIGIKTKDINALMFQTFSMMWDLDDKSGYIVGEGDYDNMQIRCFIMDEL